MPIAFLVSSMRAALDDIETALDGDMDPARRASLQQMSALIDELEKHDGAKEKVAAND